MYACICIYVCVCIHVYGGLCMHNILGNCPGEMSYPKREGELSRGNCPTPRVYRLVCRLKRRGFLSAETPDVATLVSEAENRLFQAIIADPNHVLRKHFPDILNVPTTTCAPEPMSSRSL